MADSLTPNFLRSRGEAIGDLLAGGDVKDAESRYTHLLEEVQNEIKASAGGNPNNTKLTEQEQSILAGTADEDTWQKNQNDPLVQAWQNIWQGMAETDPDDVESPGNGRAWGYSIDWQTEIVVNEAVKEAGSYCNTYGNCPFDSSPQVPAANLPIPALDYKQELIKLNREIAPNLDDFNQQTFARDYNRRASEYGIKAADDGQGVITLQQPPKLVDGPIRH